MELDSKLNFSEICRCCKRTSFGMTSIFNGSIHPTYPPVKDMLRTIASLNIHESDGLPSLVCTSCIDNIQDAYTFILHLILVDKELQQILLARGKHTNTLSQDIYDSTKKENETEPVHVGAKCLEIHDRISDYVNDSIKVEDLDEPMQIDYQHGSADNSYENLNFVVKAEEVAVCGNEEGNELLWQNEQSKTVNSVQSLSEITREDIQLNHQKHYYESYEDIGESNSDPDEAEGENEEISPKLPAKRRKTASNLHILLHHTPDERKEHAVNNDNLVKIEKTEDMEEFEDEDDLVADEDYQENNEADNSVDSSDIDSSESEFHPDAAENIDEPEVENVENSPKLRRRKMTSNSSDVLVFHCKLCSYTNARRSSLKLHLQSHFKDKPFACAKCKCTFTQKGSMVKHLPKCNGVISKQAIGKEARHIENVSNRVISLSLEDLDDPAKMEKYYTVTEIDGQHDDHDYARRTKRPVFKCKVCAYTSTVLANLQQHLRSHGTYKQFTCSKCNGRFTQKGTMTMLNHLRKCNGLNNWENRSKSMISMTLRDLMDPLKMKQYYTVSKKSERRTNFTQHVETPSNVTTFACTKCNYTFVKRGWMLRHWRNCNNIATTREVFEDVDEMGADVDYDEDNEDGNRIDSSDYDYTGQKKRSLESSGCRSGGLPNVKTKPSLALSRIKEDIGHKKVLTSVDDCINDSTRLDTADDINESVDSSESESIREACENVEQISPKWPAQQQKRVSNLADGLVYKCNLCGYTHVWLSYLREHLQSHFNDKPNACLKCNASFSKRSNMHRHLRSCNRTIRKDSSSKGKTSKRRISMILQDLYDPEKMKNYYTVTKIDMQSKNDDDDVKLQTADDWRTKEHKISSSLAPALELLKCNLCGHTSLQLSVFKRHLITHFKVKPFVCSKCNHTFAVRESMLRHWQKCNGNEGISCDICRSRPVFRSEMDLQNHNQKYHDSMASRQEISLTLEDLKDPNKLKMYYTIQKML